MRCGFLPDIEVQPGRLLRQPRRGIRVIQLLLGVVLTASLTGCGPRPEDAAIPPDPEAVARRIAAARTLLELGLPDSARAALEEVPQERQTAVALLDLARARSGPGDDDGAARAALEAAERYPDSAKEALFAALGYQERGWDWAACAATLEKLRSGHRLTSTERERVDGSGRRLRGFAGKVHAVRQDWAPEGRWPFAISDPLLADVDARAARTTLRKGPGTDPTAWTELQTPGGVVEWMVPLELERMDPGAAFQVLLRASGVGVGSGLRLEIGSWPGTLSGPAARFAMDVPLQATAAEPASVAIARVGSYRLRLRVYRAAGTAAGPCALEAALFEAEGGRRVLALEGVDPTGALAVAQRLVLSGAASCEEGSLWRVTVGAVAVRAFGGEPHPPGRGGASEDALVEGLRLMERGAWADALATLGRARHGTSEGARATFFAAQAAARVGEAAKAESLLKEALAREPALHRRAYYYLRWDRGAAGLLAGALGNAAVAEMSVRAATEDAGAGFGEAALASLDAALLRSPGSTLAREARANLLAELGRVEEALADCAELLRASPAGPGVRFLRADLLRRAGRPAEALAELDRIAAEAGERPADLVLRAWTHLRAGELEPARAATARAIQADPRSAAPYVALGLCHLQGGDAASAGIEANRALGLDPWDASAHALLGWVLAERRQPESARRELRIAAGLGEDPDALVLMARAWTMLGPSPELDRAAYAIGRAWPGGWEWVGK